jgi:hypothetical protein
MDRSLVQVMQRRLLPPVRVCIARSFVKMATPTDQCNAKSRLSTGRMWPWRAGPCGPALDTSETIHATAFSRVSLAPTIAGPMETVRRTQPRGDGGRLAGPAAWAAARHPRDLQQ